MPTFTALTTLPGEDAARALSDALERMTPAPTGVGVFEIEDGSGLWEVGAYFLEQPDEVVLDVLALAFGARPFAMSFGARREPRPATKAARGLTRARIRWFRRRRSAATASTTIVTVWLTTAASAPLDLPRRATPAPQAPLRGATTRRA